MGAEVLLIANAGFRVSTGSATIFIDAFLDAIPLSPDRPLLHPEGVSEADLILVTHAHWDHFGAAQVADVASRTGATVVGPHAVVRRLQGLLDDSALVELEPGRPSGTGAVPSARAEFPAATVTALRTFHGKGHNSYLVETRGFRFFHDGDNEDTRRIDVAALGRLDALLIGPWLGSGWVEFIEHLAPTRYFLMHLTDDELDAHEAGRFLPDLCDRVPDGLVVLRWGQSYCFGRE